MTDPTPLSSLSSALADVVARTAPSVVAVRSHRARATGFVWKPGLIVTADEALADEGEVEIGLPDGSTTAATIAGRDHTTDIALLRADTALAPVKLATTVPPLGALSVVIATNRDTPSAALGMVSLSGKSWRSLRGGDIDARIELDVRLRSSQQGGLALDASGEAFGMAVLGPRRVLVIPTATIERVAAQLEARGRIARGYLGLGLQPVRLDDGVGAMVMNVDKAGPSAAAGIRQGDVIVAVNDQKLSGVRALSRTLGPASVGAVVDVAARRGGEPVSFKVTVGREARGVSEDIAPEIVLSLEIDDPALADRLAALLGNIAGVRLAGPGEKATATIVTRDPRIMPDDIALTQRELDVLALMAEGGSNKMIARQLNISVHTVKFHVGSLLDKLDATGRTDAVAHAARRGVIEL
ncbi:S1-C subfamily serine protease/DNA-binding CsgD family transcriptional regulator [Bradyrhizobium sp. LM3.4]